MLPDVNHYPEIYEDKNGWQKRMTDIIIGHPWSITWRVKMKHILSGLALDDPTTVTHVKCSGLGTRPPGPQRACLCSGGIRLLSITQWGGLSSYVFHCLLLIDHCAAQDIMRYTCLLVSGRFVERKLFRFSAFV